MPAFCWYAESAAFIPAMTLKTEPLLVSPFSRIRMFSAGMPSSTACRAAAKPAPNSTPLTAGMENSWAAMTASTPSKKGAPSPAGKPTAAHSTTPPSESPAARASMMAAYMRLPASGSSVGTGCAWQRESASMSGQRRSSASSRSEAMERTCAPTRTPSRESSCRATPPAKA